MMPFVIPAVVLVFGLIRTYAPFFTWTLAGRAVLVGGYVVLSLPYMYRAVDTGLRAIDVRSLTEAAQSLGAGWPVILLRVILPNLRVALLSGAFLTLAIVIGEYTLAALLAQPAFGPYMALLGQNRAYEPAALAIMSFALTWAAMGLIQFLGRGRQQQSELAGTH
jgi:putative spermidine/putrescine transport system permease protein